MMKRLIPALLAAAAATPAAALMHPKYYEQARQKAPDVVVIEVLKVTPPPEPTGACQVEGKVLFVERGERRKVGEAITLEVMCRAPGAEIRSGGVIWQDRDKLTAANAGRAWLDKDGEVALYQYEVLQLLR